MANLVEQIYDALVSTTASALGAGWNPMPFVREPEKNDFRRVNDSYGVRALDAIAANTVTRVYALDHNFEVLLAKRYIERNDESDLADAELELYNKADSIFTQSVLTRLGLTGLTPLGFQVLEVFDQRLSAPEKLPNQVVLIRLGLTVKYRNTLSL